MVLSTKTTSIIATTPITPSMPAIGGLTNEVGDLPHEQDNAIVNGLMLLARPIKDIAIENEIRVRSSSLNYSNPASTSLDLDDNPVSDPYPISFPHSFTYIDPHTPTSIVTANMACKIGVSCCCC